MQDFFPIKLYESLPESIFPYEIEEGHYIEEIFATCDVCDSGIGKLKIISSPIIKNCYDIRLGGYCSTCGVYQSGKLRYHTINKKFVEFSKDGSKVVRELQPEKESLMKKLIDKMRKLFGK